MADVLLPLMLPFYQRSGQETWRRLRQQMRGKSLVKDEGGPAGPLAEAFDIFNPRILDAVRSAVFRFCDATNATSVTRIETALDLLRGSLAAGLEAGIAQKAMVERVQAIFQDPQRAFAIAVTETSRAVHSGQEIAARESGVVVGKHGCYRTTLARSARASSPRIQPCRSTRTLPSSEPGRMPGFLTPLHTYTACVPGQRY